MNLSIKDKKEPLNQIDLRALFYAGSWRFEAGSYICVLKRPIVIP
jgi:hypothetical protein